MTWYMTSNGRIVRPIHGSFGLVLGLLDMNGAVIGYKEGRQVGMSSWETLHDSGKYFGIRVVHTPLEPFEVMPSWQR